MPPRSPPFGSVGACLPGSQTRRRAGRPPTADEVPLVLGKLAGDPAPAAGAGRGAPAHWTGTSSPWTGLQEPVQTGQMVTSGRAPALSEALRNAPAHPRREGCRPTRAASEPPARRRRECLKDIRARAPGGCGNAARAGVAGEIPARDRRAGSESARTAIHTPGCRETVNTRPSPSRSPARRSQSASRRRTARTAARAALSGRPGFWAPAGPCIPIHGNRGGRPRVWPLRGRRHLLSFGASACARACVSWR